MRTPRARNTQMVNSLRAIRRAAGLCICGRERLTERKMCRRCTARSEALRVRRRKLERVPGTCRMCLKRAPTPGTRLCDDCRRRARDYQVESRIRRGLATGYLTTRWLIRAIPERDWERALILAVAEGMTLTDLVHHAIESYLDLAESVPAEPRSAEVQGASLVAA